jgi:hypothetical protein
MSFLASLFAWLGTGATAGATAGAAAGAANPALAGMTLGDFAQTGADSLATLSPGEVNTLASQIGETAAGGGGPSSFLPQLLQQLAGHGGSGESAPTAPTGVMPNLQSIIQSSYQRGLTGVPMGVPPIGLRNG